MKRKPMDAKQVKEITGLTYGQLNYLIDQVDALKRDKTQGKARDFSFRDLVLLKLASVMRADGLRLDEINDAFNGLNRMCIDIEKVEDAGVLVCTGNEMYRWFWTKQNIFVTGKFPPRSSIPKCFYSISSIVREVGLF